MKYALGLDLGTTSIGWSVINLDKNRIEDLGVRIFEKPENPKDGKSLAVPRRTARSARRRLKRRRQRLNYLKQFFIENQLLSSAQIEQLLTPHTGQLDPYILRQKGLTEQLSPEELFIALHHIAKRRGYKSNRKAVEEKDPEGSKVLSAISENAKLLDTYQTVGAALLNDDKFKTHRRNKADNYQNSFVRANFENEIRAILTKQQQFYPVLTNQNIRLLLLGDVEQGNKNGLFYQRPFMTKELIAQMRGKCPYEKDQPRLQKASYTFEMFRLAQDLSHLTYSLRDTDGALKEKIQLTPEQIQACIDKCKATRKVTYRAIREVLGHKDDNNFAFDYIRGKDPKHEELEKDHNAKEKNTFAELKFYHDIKKSAKDSPDDWRKIEADKDLFDYIGEVLTVNKDDSIIEEDLRKLTTFYGAPVNLSEQSIANLMRLSYSGFGHLSAKVIRKITPFILEGNTYDKALVLAGYEFNQRLNGEESKLPPLNEDEQNQITNPIVKRAISQTIKVINAIIRKYGAPVRIGVESAGELAKNFQERMKIKRDQDENAAVNQKIIERLQNEFHIPTPTGLQISKFKFYREQDAKCLYCGEALSLNELFSDKSYGEIDHIIPFSRCGNDSRANKALVHNKCNQDKRNMTPFEVWGHTERWRDFCARVTANHKLSRGKQQRLLAESLPKENWNARALNDTRYVEKFLAQYLRRHLKFAKYDNNDTDSANGQPVVTPTGQITTFFRRAWGIPHKDRDADCLHHSVDATIIALTTRSSIQRLSQLNKWREVSKYLPMDTRTAVDKRTGEVVEYVSAKDTLPWPNFVNELGWRESQPKAGETLAQWRDQFRDVYKDQDEEFKKSIHPIFVSRMPKRGGDGPVNKETIRSPKSKGDMRTVRTSLSKINLKALDDSVLPESDRALYEQLKQRLTENSNDPAKAFAEPVYKNDKRFDKNGRPLSPVSAIKVYSKNPDTSGFLVNHGKAYVNNGSMIRLDVYKKVNAKGKTEHFFVPIYAHQARIGSKRILPEPKKGPKFIDDSFEKVCELFSNDYVKISAPDKVVEGYYVKYNIANGGITLRKHFSPGASLDFKTGAKSATSIQRLDINVLGDNYRWE